MANGFDPSKITKQLRSPRNLLEFSDISIQPRQVSTAEVIANTLDNAFERASQTYLQGKQLDSQVQQQQIQSDLRREQLDIEQDRYQRSEDRATDNVLMGGLKDIDLKSEADRLEARATISEMSDPKLRRILTSRLDVSEVGAIRLSKFEEIFQGENINEIMTKKYTFEGKEKEGKKLLDEYMAINPTGKGMFGVSKDKMLMDMTAKYRGNAEYYDLAYGKFENEKGDEVSHIDVLFDSDKDRKTFRALSPIDGSKFLASTLEKKGITKEQTSILSGFRSDIRNVNDSINRKLGQISNDTYKGDIVIKLQKDIERLEEEKRVSKQNINSFYTKLGFATIPISSNNTTNNLSDKDKVITGNINSFKGLNKSEQQSFLQNHPQLQEIKSIVNTYSVENKDLSLTSPEFLDSLSKIGIFNDTIKTTQGFPSVVGKPVVTEGAVDPANVDSIKTEPVITSPPLPDVARPVSNIPPQSEGIADDLTLENLNFGEDISEFKDPSGVKQIEDNPNKYVANSPKTASMQIVKPLNALPKAIALLQKEEIRLDKYKERLPEGYIEKQLTPFRNKILKIQEEIKSKFEGYINLDTGDFSNEKYTNDFYKSLSSSKKLTNNQSPQELKNLIQRIISGTYR